MQINFADDALSDYEYPAIAERSRYAMENMVGDDSVRRWIDTEHQPTRWKLESTMDGERCCPSTTSRAKKNSLIVQ